MKNRQFVNNNTAILFLFVIGRLYSYNIPELTKGAVEVSPYEIQQVAEKNKPEQVRFK